MNFSLSFTHNLYVFENFLMRGSIGFYVISLHFKHLYMSLFLFLFTLRNSQYCVDLYLSLQVVHVLLFVSDKLSTRESNEEFINRKLFINLRV